MTSFFAIFMHLLKTSERSFGIDARMEFLVIEFCSDPSPTSVKEDEKA